MRNYLFIKGFLLVVLIFALPSIVEAQATRTWVSGVGDDVNPCSRTAPCKTFAGAISKTAMNGEINCLDPAGFGTVTITKSITIDCTGTLGGVLSSGTNGIIINITGTVDTKKAVKLRGLQINGAGTGTNGIRIIAANSVNVEHTVIDSFTQHGISIETTAGNPKIVVDNTTIRSNTGNGVNSNITGGAVFVTVNNSQLALNAVGLNLNNNTKAVIKNSIVTGNASGLIATQAELSVTGCAISNNTIGIASSVGTVRISGNMITGNDTGLAVSRGGSIISFGNNVINGNTTNGAPTSTVSQT